MLLNKKQVEDIKRKDADMNDGQQNKHPQEEEIDLLELALKVRAQVDIEVLRLCSDCGTGDCF